MSDRHRPHVNALLACATDTPGETTAELRRAVQALVHRIVNGDSVAASEAGTAEATRDVGDTPAIPAPVATFVENVARHAWKVTDRDVAALRQAGLSEDTIFEITVSAAVAAGTGRLDRALAVLRSRPS